MVLLALFSFSVLAAVASQSHNSPSSTPGGEVSSLTNLRNDVPNLLASSPEKLASVSSANVLQTPRSLSLLDLVVLVAVLFAEAAVATGLQMQKNNAQTTLFFKS